MNNHTAAKSDGGFGLWISIGNRSAKGDIVREICRTDLRAKVVSLSNEGVAVRSSAIRISEEWNNILKKEVNHEDWLLVENVLKKNCTFVNRMKFW